MKCNNCGKEINDRAKFCNFCGAPAANQAFENVEQSGARMMRCPSCGKALKAGSTFCVYCGARVSQSGAGSAAASPAPYHSGQNKSPAGSIVLPVIAAVVIVLAAAAVLTYLFVFRNMAGDGGEMNQATEEMTETENAVGDAQYEAVDERVEAIKAVCRSIDAGISNRFYDEVMISSGIKAYYDSEGLKAVVATNSWAYVREYYYDAGELVYVGYSGSDSHEFYCADGHMILWNYIDEDGNVEANSDINSQEFEMWASEILSASDEFVRLWEESVTEASVSEYILEGSDSRYISESELEGFTKEECRLARNEIYARHGRKFEDESLTEYFSQFDWYVPTIEASAFTESMLNAYEIANRDLIVAYETKQGYR